MDDPSIWSFFKANSKTVLMNFMAFTSLLFLLTFHKFLGLVPIHRGFFCDDHSISLPLLPETVTTKMLIAGMLGTAVVVVVVVEFLVCINQRDSRHADSEYQEVRPAKANLCFRVTKEIFLVLFGFMVMVALVEMIKFSMGGLRPHFLQVCKPVDYNCSLGFVTEYKCTQSDRKLLINAKKSFVSGHAAIAFYCMTFVIGLLQLRIPKSAVAARCLLQGCALGLAIYISITRITDHFHHPSDVIFGMILGTLCGVAVVEVLRETRQNKELTSLLGQDKTLEHIAEEAGIPNSQNVAMVKQDVSVSPKPSAFSVDEPYRMKSPFASVQDMIFSL